LSVRAHDAVEEGEHDEEEGEDVRNNCEGWSECTDPLSPAFLE